VFVPCKPFQDTIAFEGKAGAYPSETPLGCTTLEWAHGLAHKQMTRLERLARDKHFSLLRKFVIYVRKKFYIIGPKSLCSIFHYILQNIIDLRILKFAMKLFLKNKILIN
jgi:hypothetical protein